MAERGDMKLRRGLESVARVSVAVRSCNFGTRLSHHRKSLESPSHSK